MVTRLAPIRIVAPVLIVTVIPVAVVRISAARGAKLAQILHVSGEHIAVPPAQLIGVRKVFEILNRLVQLAGIEFALSPSSFEFLELLGSLVKVPSLMTVDAGIRSSHVEVGQHSSYQWVPISSVAIAIVPISTLIRVITSVGIISIIGIITLRVVGTLAARLCPGRDGKNQEAGAKQDT